MAQETGGIIKSDEQEKKGSTTLATGTSSGLTGTSTTTFTDTPTKTTTAVDDEMNGGADTEQIRSKIDETRTDLGETLDEIQERLSVSNISEQVTEQVNTAIETVKTTAYDATIGKAVNFMERAGEDFRHTAVGRTVMQNPVPFVLIGAGTVMLLMNLKGRGTARATYLGSRKGSDGRALPGARGIDTTSSFKGSRQGSGEGMMDKAKHTYEDAYGAVSETAESAYDAVAGAAESTYASATGLVSKARDRAGDLGHLAQENYEYYAEEKPLALAAAAVAVGAAIGFAIPSSRYESEMMGETRDNLLEKAEATAGDLVDQAKETASSVGKAASEELGLSEEQSGKFGMGGEGATGMSQPSSQKNDPNKPGQQRKS